MNYTELTENYKLEDIDMIVIINNYYNHLINNKKAFLFISDDKEVGENSGKIMVYESLKFDDYSDDYLFSNHYYTSQDDNMEYYIVKSVKEASNILDNIFLLG